MFGFPLMKVTHAGELVNAIDKNIKMKKQKKYKKKLKYTKRNQNNSYQKRILIDKEIKADIVENEDSQKDSYHELILTNEEIKAGILVNENNQKDFPNTNERKIHSYSYAFSKIAWKGMITIKIFPYSYSNDNDLARCNRQVFLDNLMGNLKSKLKIPNNEFQWIACEEFGIEGVGHLHVLFTFDNLTDGIKNKIKINDFSNDGKFNAQLQESACFIGKKLSIAPNNMDIHWDSQWYNVGLVRYFCKIEYGLEDKLFIFSTYCNKLSLVTAA